MRIVHRLKTIGICPVNQDEDYYTVEIRLERDSPDLFPMIEDITDLMEKLLSIPVTQEQFTFDLSRQLRARVSTVCKHREVESECCCEAPL